MNKTYFDICGTKLCLESQDDFYGREYSAFLTDDSSGVDIHVLELKEERKGGMDGAAFSFAENDVSWYVARDGGMIMTFFYPVPRLEILDGDTEKLSEEPLRRLYVNRDFSYAEYECVGYPLSQLFFKIGGEVLYRCHNILRGGMIMHAVSVNYHGEAILFSGVSGMGKTTQADLWTGFTGSHIINGDRATLLYRDGRLITTGSAWSGSSGIYLNESAPIKAIVFLEQAAFNQLIELTPQTALSYMVPRCLLPYYSQELMSLALSNIDRIAGSIPTYLLRNKADRQSVELVRKAVFGG